MNTASLNCPFCCNETFDSQETLKLHIFDLLNKLECPICKKNVTAFENFAQHLKECKTVPILETTNGESLEDVHENSVLIQDVENSEENHAGNDYYCEICDVYFAEMKKHLIENHIGQQVVIESQDLDEILEESNLNSQDEAESKIETTPEINATETEHIFLEQEILDKDGRFYTKKLTKINIIPECEGSQSIIEINKDISSDAITESSLVYHCQDCDLKFSQFNYEKHKCSPKKGGICSMCSTHFLTNLELSEHKKSCHSKRLQKEGSICEICHIQFPSRKSMMLHKRIHAPKTYQGIIDPPATYNINGIKVSEEINETFTCEICGREYNKKYEDVHIKSHREEVLNCSICNRKFFNKDDLTLHLQAHGNDVENKISCRFCKKTFMATESLDDHVQNHCERRKYCCNFCGKKFSKPHEKVKHERIHTGHKPYVCQICGKTFRVSYCLTLHMRTHSGIRPYRCETCDKRFKSHGAYTHHVQIHSDVRSYQCPFCPKAFKTSVQLAAHKNTHTKPFSCNICNRPFASLYAVRLHTKSHDRTNELKYQCHICGAEYARYFALRDHMGTHSDAEENLLQLQKKIGKKRNIKTKIQHGKQLSDSSS